MSSLSLWNTLSSWLSYLWQSLGLAGKEGSLLLLGLDNAGKTTLLHRLQTGGDIRPFPPTDRPSWQEFSVRTGNHKELKFQAWDLGGHEAVRHLWQDYAVPSTSMNGSDSNNNSNATSNNSSKLCVLFVIDAADSDRLEEAAYELDALVAEGLLQDKPVAILLNKCDLAHALETAEIGERLELSRLQQEHQAQMTLQNRESMAVFRISVLKGEGYQEAFQWIGGFL